MENFEKLVPHSIEDEMCVIAAAMLDSEMCRKIRRVLKPNHFFSIDNQIIYGAVVELADTGKAIDARTVNAYLKSTARYDEVGGIDYLAKILNTIPSTAHGETYAGNVLELAKRRETIRICNHAIREAYRPLRDTDSAEILGTLADHAASIRTVGTSRRCTMVEDAIDAFLESRSTGGDGDIVRTRINAVDETFLGFLRLQGYTIVAGRPSMGKSTLARYMLDQIAAGGETVGLIAIEESLSKIAGNYVSAHSGIENRRIDAGNWAKEEWDEINKARLRLSGRPMFIVDDAFTVQEVLDAMEMLATEKKCKVIAIDHVHLLGFDGEKKSDNRNNEVSAISRMIKAAIRKFNVAGIVVAQLSRPDKSQTVPPPPKLSDLRDSGSLEQDADAVMFVHREDYYRQMEQGYIKNHICQLIVPKLRNGATGMTYVREEMQYQRFAELPEQSNSFDPFGGVE